MISKKSGRKIVGWTVKYGYLYESAHGGQGTKTANPRLRWMSDSVQDAKDLAHYSGGSVVALVERRPDPTSLADAQDIVTLRTELVEAKAALVKTQRELDQVLADFAACRTKCAGLARELGYALEAVWAEIRGPINRKEAQ